MGIPFLVSRSGLTQMGYDLARRVGMTMIGRAQGKHYLLFTGAERFKRRNETALDTESTEAQRTQRESFL